MAPKKQSKKKVSGRTVKKKAATKGSASGSIPEQVEGAMAWLKKNAVARIRDEMGSRYGIHTSDVTLGVSMANMKKLAKELGRSHELAAALWETGCYEARMVACMVDEPERVTGAQMDRWCRDFDNWGLCDTVCFCLFDRVDADVAWSRVEKWSDGGAKNAEFIKRGAFALLACLALHSKTMEGARFVEGLALIEKAATDERNFVKKGVSWALRAIGRRSDSLRTAAVELATELASANSQAARWIGKDALRDLRGAKIRGE